MQNPFGSMQAMMGQFQGFMSNPMGYMMQRKLNIPKQYMNDPQGAIQYLMNNGKVSQEMYDWAVNEANKLQNNSQFMQMFKH